MKIESRLGLNVYVLIPKDEAAQRWIDDNIQPDAIRNEDGIVIESRHIIDIMRAIKEAGLRDKFEVQF